ncbi:MAG: pilus assembly protein PilP [Gammaproteobacteria bacterium]|nr:MAG: pilus assembly protein PilP [Gammaproteobacteria bacterium]
MKNTLRAFLVLCMVAVLSGCADDGLSDLRQFVKDAHADRKPKVEPIPEVKTHEVFAYASAEGIDPFGVFNLRPRGTKSARYEGPNLRRRKEPLEEYPLDALKMVGTITRRNQSWVIIQAPDGTVHRAQVGNHLGQNFGEVTGINEEKVELVETIQNPLGDWIKRDASISIEE